MRSGAPTAGAPPPPSPPLSKLSTLPAPSLPAAVAMSSRASSAVHLPSVGSHLLLSIPSEHVFQLILNRPAQLNSMTDALEADLRLALSYFDSHPTLRVAIIAGRGKIFCAGQDLKAWLANQEAEATTHSATATNSNTLASADSEGAALESNASVNHKIEKLKAGGFGGLSSRRSVKPIIACVDGICFGGGMEIVLNCDLVVASSRSLFALPEASRGVIASQGGIARLARICGHQRAAEMLLLCEPIPPQAFNAFHFINRLVPLPPAQKSTSPGTSDQQTMSWDEGERAVLSLGLDLARKISNQSPDAVQLTKAALLAARGSTPSVLEANSNVLAGHVTESLSSHVDDFQAGDVDLLAVQLYRSRRSRAMYAGENIQEGLKSFKEKRQPAWEDAPLIDAGSTPPGWEDKGRSKL
ncbi:hypothetical protein V8E36_001564 [Tilletia maclaganii]